LATACAAAARTSAGASASTSAAATAMATVLVCRSRIVGIYASVGVYGMPVAAKEATASVIGNISIDNAELNDKHDRHKENHHKRGAVFVRGKTVV